VSPRSLVQRGHTVLKLTRLGLLAGAVSLGLVATTTPAAALPDWSTERTLHRSGSTIRVLDLRYAEHPRFDRVVLDLRGKNPGYEIAYVRFLRYDFRGTKVHLKGRRHMSLTLKPSASGHTAAGKALYEGPQRIYVDLPTLKGIAVTGDFEGFFSVGFSTDRRAAYRAFTLRNPSRLVIDWKH
jgi:hypothetical protein